MNRTLCAAALLSLLSTSTVFAQGTLSGELRTWHTVTVSFQGPSARETGTPNPFRFYRLDVTFVNGADTFVVPGYFAADGNAAETHADEGNVWQVHFAPNATGTWTYTASFRSGTDVAVAADASAGSPASFDGAMGTFTVDPTDKTGRDLRGKGMLQYVGGHYLRFAGTGEYFLKQGSDAPENLLAYEDFDDTPNDPNHNANLRKSWSPHAGDYDPADASAYTWDGGKGSELLGALSYLHDEGLNAFSFLTFNVDGDDDNVFPHRLNSSTADYEAVADNQRWAGTVLHHDRFDVSKLAQWERVFAYADKKGLFLHFKTMETENELLMDGGDLGPERTLYYRELIARFGHHLALNWNLGEEINDASTQQKTDWAQYFHDTDPYHHHIVIHNGSNHYDLLGPGSALTGFSLQTNNAAFVNVHDQVKNYLSRSAAAGKPWAVACDEPGDATHALRPDDDAGTSHEDGRKNGIWGTFMAGGWGNEWYFGYQHDESDLTCQDFRSRDLWWDYCRYALEFFVNNAIPVWEMQNDNDLSTNADDYCFYKPDAVYVVYLKEGGSTELDLSATNGTFHVHWYDPRNGGHLLTGSVSLVSGGDTVSLGSPPGSPLEDWVVVLQRMVDTRSTRPDGVRLQRISGLSSGQYGDVFRVDGARVTGQRATGAHLVQPRSPGAYLVRIVHEDGATGIRTDRSGRQLTPGPCLPV